MHRRDEGFALLTVLVVIVIVGLIGSTGLRTSELAEMLSGSVIQRSRAFQAAEGALMLSEDELAAKVRANAIADATATDEVFSSGSVGDRWWASETFTGASSVADDTFLGVTSPPSYVTEEIGGYIADGGSGIVSLDRGSGSYGRQTSSGREIVLFRVQSHGTGSVDAVQAVVESLYVQTR